MNELHRNRGTATKAIQAITIGGGIANDTFATQVDVANKLRRYVVEELHGQYNMGKNTATQIEFAHSVFTKVRDSCDQRNAVAHARAR